MPGIRRLGGTFEQERDSVTNDDDESKDLANNGQCVGVGAMNELALCFFCFPLINQRNSWYTLNCHEHPPTGVDYTRCQHLKADDSPTNLMAHIATHRHMFTPTYFATHAPMYVNASG